MSKERLKYYKAQLGGLREQVRQILAEAAQDDSLNVSEFMQLNLIPVYEVACDEEGNFYEI